MINWISGWVERLTYLAISRGAPANERERRSRSVVRGTITAVISRAIAALTGFVTVPLTVTYLGAERYGAWITIGSVMVFFSFTDLGLGSSLTNALGTAYGNADRDRGRRYVASTLFALSVIGIVIACAGVLAARPLISFVFPMIPADVREHELVPAVLIAVGLFAVGLPLSVINRVLAALQETATANLWAIAANLTNLAAILGVVWMRGGLPLLVLGSGGAGGVVAIVSAAWLFGWHKPWLRPSLGDVDRRFVRELFGSGWKFFLIGVGWMINSQTDNIVIAHYLGAASVTPYSVTFRLFAYSTLIQSFAFASLWPAFTEAAARRDYDWIRGIFRKTLRWSLLIAVPTLAVLTIFGRDIIRIWAGPAAVPPRPVLAWMAAWNLMLAHLYVPSCLLHALGRINGLVIYGTATAALNVALSIFAVQRFGIAGVIAGTVIAYGLASYIPLLLQARGVLRGFAAPTVPPPMNGFANR